MTLVLTENPQLEALVLELARAASGCDRSVLGKMSNTVLSETWPVFRKRLAGMMDEAGLSVDEANAHYVADYKKEAQRAAELEEVRQKKESARAEKRERTSAKQSESARVRAAAKAAAKAAEAEAEAKAAAEADAWLTVVEDGVAKAPAGAAAGSNKAAVQAAKASTAAATPARSETARAAPQTSTFDLTPDYLKWDDDKVN